MANLHWNSQELNQNDSPGTTSDSFADHTGSLQQGYPLGSLTDGLVAYYPFDGDVKDYALNNDGTDNTSAGYVSGKVGSDAKDFDGNDDWINIGETLTGPSAFTLSAWIKQPSFGSFNEIAARADSDASQREYTFRTESGTSAILIYDSSNTAYKITGSSLSTNTWYHLAAIYDGVNLRLFENGSQVNSSTPSITIPDTGSGGITAIGRFGDQSSEHFGGSIDDLRIYDRALSQPEIQALYQRTQTQTITDQDRLTSGLVGHWPLNEDQPNTAYDLSGRGNDSASVTGTTVTTGLGGSPSRYFNGSEKITTGSSLNSSFTISYFIRVPRKGDDYEGVIASNNSKTTSSWQHSWWNGDLIYSSDPGNFGNLNADTWYHIASSFDDATNELKCFRNGTQTSANTSNNELNVENLVLGTNRAQDNHHKGRLADVRLYNRALSQSEIKTLARLGGIQTQ